MNRRGPLLTLVVGLVLALVVLAVSVNAADDGQPAGQAAPPTVTVTVTVTPTATSTPVPAPTTTWAGRVDGGGPTIAISTRDGQAVAYLCDGDRIEVWLQGSAVDGRLDLTGNGGTALEGSYAEDGGRLVAEGSIRTRGEEWTFTVRPVRKPSGLYRFASQVRDARVVGGWIVLADGTQVGVLSVDGRPRPAPRLDVAEGSAEVEGTRVRVSPVEGGIDG